MHRAEHMFYSMLATLGYDSFRMVEVDHPVAMRIVCADGRQHRQMSRAASWIVARQPDRRRARRFVRAAMWPLNVYRSKVATAGAGYDILDRFTSSVEECRVVQDAALAALEVPSDESKDRDGSYWLKPKAAMHARVSDVVLGMRMITEALTLDGVFDGQDPSKIDRRLSRIEGKGSKTVQTRRGIRMDADARFRIGENPNHAPRYDDPRFYQRLVEGLEITEAPAAIRRGCGMAFSSGGRFVSVFSLDMYGYLVLSPKARHYPTRNKGDAADDRSFEMILSSSEDARLLEYIAGERAKRSGYSLDELRLMAADPDRHDELRRMPVLTEDGVNPVRYGRLWRVFRRAAIAMDLFIDDDEYRRTKLKRWVTFHYLRHEYVHLRLDRIRRMKSEAARIAERKALKFYMRWKSDGMLDWYSMHHEVKHADRSAEEFNDEQDEAMAAGGLPADDTDAPEAGEELLEDAFG